jgi:hypothetical protein
VRLFAAYAAAAAIGIGAAFLVLWIARSAQSGADPQLVAVAIVGALGVIAAGLAAAAPRHWLALGLVVSIPLALLGIVMFAALAGLGEFFWIWLWVGLGATGAALLGAYLVGRRR